MKTRDTINKVSVGLLLMLTLFGGAAHAQLNNGLLAYYPFDGNANDASGNNFDGTSVTATLTADRNNVANAAYLFNGVQQIALTADPAFGNPDLTVSLWFQATASFNPPGSLAQRMYASISGNSNRQNFSLNYNVNNNDLVEIRSEPTDPLPGGFFLNAPNPIDNSLWYHMVAVRDFTNNQARIYLNNSLVATTSIPYFPNFPTPVSLHSIGMYPSGSQGFVGKIDDVGIWSRALTASEVDSLFNGADPTYVAPIPTVYVNPSATGSNDGTSWANGFINLQDAIDAATSGGEIWVMAGTYVPDRDSSGNASPADIREKTFAVNGKTLNIYGGFTGVETSVSQRDLANNISVISGDIGVQGDFNDNCYVLMYSTGSGVLTIDGFEFYAANAVQASGYYKGAVTSTGRTDINNCRFVQNRSRRGGGLVSFNNPLVITNCLFEENETTEQGGGIYSEYAMTIRNSRFTKNTSPYGGAIKFAFISGGVNIVDNCLIYDNTSSTSGAAIQVFSASVEVFNSTIVNNSTLGTGHAFSIYQASLFNVYNSIVWNANTSAQAAHLDNGNNVYVFNNCIVSEAVTGNNNLNLNPQFTDSTYSFKLSKCSPALDAGDSTLLVSTTTKDFYGNPRVGGGNVDIGAVEYKKFDITWDGTNLIFPEGGAASYQWIDCNTGLAISGEVNDTLTPTISGDYALVYTYGTCTDTSDCLNVTILGQELMLNDEIRIYPNPSRGSITIENAEHTLLKVSLMSLSGKEIQSWEVSGLSEQLNLNARTGFYILKIQNENGSSVSRKIILE